jgi:tRNA pseudouridine65 synthase
VQAGRLQLKLLHQDEHLCAVDKPAGMLVHRGWGDDDLVGVTAARIATGHFVYPVHRLDRGASGVLVFAFDSTTAAALHDAFTDGRVKKRYLALVRGRAPRAADIDHPIPRREDGPRVPARTRIELVSTTPDGRYSWVAAYPEGGRLHQVRRHLKHISHPIIGDANYGKGEHNRHWRTEFGLGRLALHAQSVRFVHPGTGFELVVAAEVPEDLRGPLAKAGISV